MRKRRKLLAKFAKSMIYLFLGVHLLFINGCTSGNDNTLLLKAGHVLPVDHPVHEAIEFMAQRLDVISSGKMGIEVYPGGTLGNEREMMELLQFGSLAITKVSSSPMESFVAEMKVFSMPYVFRDSEHFWRVLNSNLGKKLLLSGESVHLRGLAYYDAGSRSFYTTKKPIHEPAQLSGLKIRVQKSQTSLQMVKALGGAGTPISFGELYTALDQGVVDGAENNPPSFYSSRHYEVAKYYSLDEHTYVPDILLISSYIWKTLSEQQQVWLQQAVDESVVYQRKLWNEATEFALREVAKSGVNIIYPDKSQFAEKVSAMHDAVKGLPVHNLIMAFQELK